MTLFWVRLKTENVIFVHRAYEFITVFAKAKHRIVLANYMLRMHEV